jgi:menaquinone reductase, multiheme cytochrome c subunit
MNRRMDRYVFPAWTNRLRVLLAVGAIGGLVYVVAFVWYGFSPRTTAVGYAPEQPVPYSHALHAGKLGMDCRYCHSTVEVAAMAAVPAAGTCMNCHRMVRAASTKLTPVRESAAGDVPVPWVRVHNLPDFVYFNHSAHVRRGVGCVSCHGRVDKMDVVTLVQPLSMGWCLECHRAPEQHLRPPEAVTAMDWSPVPDQLTVGARLREANGINPPTDCVTCHR